MDNATKTFEINVSKSISNMEQKPAYVRVLKHGTDGGVELITSGATVNAKDYCGKKNSIFREHRQGIYKPWNGTNASKNKAVYEDAKGIIWFDVIYMPIDQAEAHRQVDYSKDVVLLPDNKLKKVA